MKNSLPAPASGPQRTLFCVIAAIGAAALADPLVEFFSNAGVFGRCDCTDHSNLDVIPALGISLVLAIGLLTWRIRYLLMGRSSADRAGWLASGEVLRPSQLARFVPVIFAIQIAVLFVMETAEQVVVGGHAMGGSIWLGGPVAISLGVHAACTIVTTFAIGRALCATTKTAIRIILRLATATAARGPRRMSAPCRYPATFRRPSPLVCRIGERAPPLAIA